MNKVELLAPAGNMDCLKAAVNYGADAVYFGGTSFSARAFAGNFDHDNIKEAVKYCHLRGVKLYMTINTLLSENELENALNEAKFAYDNNVDALIVQDLGLIYRIRQEMPDFDLHASTQMHVHNIEGVKACKKLGFKKVVVARESNLEFIKEACSQDIDIETFIHGAICVSYSGQCLMSSFSKNRSANKGMCAQCCRLKYSLYENGNKVNTDTDYLLSPKDMFLLNDIPSLIKAGVKSFKIEGRMKSSAYVGLVTSIYRKAIDAYYNNEKFNLSQKEYNDLLLVFNRGFTNSYLLDNNADIFSNFRPNHMGKEIGKVIDYRDGNCLIRLFSDINQFDGIRIISKKGDTGKILNSLTVNKKLVSKAYKNEIITVKVDSPVLKGDRVVRTLDFNLEESINNYQLKKQEISINIDFIENKPIIVECCLNDIKYSKIFDICPDAALKAPISKETLFNVFSKVDFNPFILTKLEGNIGNAFMPKSKINEIRREFYESFNEYILSLFKRNRNDFIKLEHIWDSNPKADLNNIEDSNLNIYINEDKLPVINLNSDYSSDYICDIGGLFKGDAKIAYYTLNICNSYAYELLKRLGFKSIVLSSELKPLQVNSLIEAYKKRIGDIKPYVVIGNRTLMYIKRNPFIKYLRDSNPDLNPERCFNLQLFDGINKYDVKILNEVRIIENKDNKDEFDDSVNRCYIERD